MNAEMLSRMHRGRPVAILSALAEEQEGIREQLSEPVHRVHAGRSYWQGRLSGVPVVLALSRIGKVAAATTAAALIEQFSVGSVLFTGVAGGLGPGIAVGDVVVGTGFVQHDMDASPLFPRFEVPLTAQTVFPGDGRLTQRLHLACQHALAGGATGSRPPVVHQGLIASGDRFVSSAAEARALVNQLRAANLQVLAVEMEGAAVAQVCSDYGVPFAAVRTISDRADDSAHTDFAQFVSTVAASYAQKIIAAWIQLLLKE